MVKRAKSNLKNILDKKDMSIRQLSKETGIQFETLRRLYHDSSKQYSRDTIGLVCEVLDIEVSDLLLLVDIKENEKNHQS